MFTQKRVRIALSTRGRHSFTTQRRDGQCNRTRRLFSGMYPFLASLARITTAGALARDYRFRHFVNCTSIYRTVCHVSWWYTQLTTRVTPQVLPVLTPDRKFEGCPPHLESGRRDDCLWQTTGCTVVVCRALAVASWRLSQVQISTERRSIATAASDAGAACAPPASTSPRPRHTHPRALTAFLHINPGHPDYLFTAPRSSFALSYICFRHITFRSPDFA